MMEETGKTERKDMKTETRDTKVTPTSLASVAANQQPRKNAREVVEGMGLEARSIYAWFGKKLVLEDISMDFAPGTVTALIGPSGCGKSTFIRILNRMHEFIPTAALAGDVLLGGKDIYGAGVDVTKIRLKIGMVFQKPNPFPSMSIFENVVAGLKLQGIKQKSILMETAEQCLLKAALWDEVKDKLNQDGSSLSGGQQQRLCIARALAVEPTILLMDEPTSALDPIATAKIEELLSEIKKDCTVIIVTHNMQQAARVSDTTSFFIYGQLIEHNLSSTIFTNPKEKQTEDYISGRFG